MKKKLFNVIIQLIFFSFLFAKSPDKNEVFVKGSNILMQEYIKFCDSTTEIKDLYVQKYEVTRSEYEEYLDFFGYNTLKDYSKDGGLFTYNNMMPHPDAAAVLITFYDACKYCNWRSKLDGFEPAYIIENELPFAVEYAQWKQENGQWVFYVPKMPEIKLNKSANGYRLPTINEYFYILLGGNEGIKIKWWKGIDITKYEFFATSHFTNKVGSLKANPLGVYDIFSNAPEWIWAETNTYSRDDSINYAKHAIGYALREESLPNFNLIRYISNKKSLSTVSPLERWFIGMRMVRNAE